MPRSMVGRLAAAGVAMSALVGLLHGDSAPVMIVGAAAATCLATCLALPASKKPSSTLITLLLRKFR